MSSITMSSDIKSLDGSKLPSPPTPSSPDLIKQKKQRVNAA